VKPYPSLMRFFFSSRRRHTRSKRDWSSDVCSSDLVKENAQGEKRMLPDVLDMPAALGSDLALTLLEEQGTTGYENYSENMEKLRSEERRVGKERRYRWAGGREEEETEEE